MDDVQVHYNSDQPAQLNAHAYTQGTTIHLAPGQETHLPHEAWHVVQQKQGRVQPTFQMKSNVKINDEVGLEKEADRMGAQAMQMPHLGNSGLEPPIHYEHAAPLQRTLSSDGPAVKPPAHRSSDLAQMPIQRAISINSKSFDVYGAYDQVIKKKSSLENYGLELRLGILPAYDRNKEAFASVDDLVGQLERIIKTYAALYNVDGYKELKSYIHNQELAQTKVKTNAAWFKSLVTTAGFEHEFADMQDSPLAGVSHMEIAKSAETLPYANLPFFVETDAANALELVSPPFLFPTVKGSTVPMAAVVQAADTLMKKTLYNLLTKAPKWGLNTYYTRSYIVQTINQLLVALSKATGFTFNLIPNLKLKPGYLSHNADLKKVSKHVVPSLTDPNTLIVDPHSLGNINVSKSEKSSSESYNIGSQVNFATDMTTTGHLQRTEGVQQRTAEIFRYIHQQLRKYIPAPSKGSSGLAPFYEIMIGKLAGLFAVYSQDHVRNAQAELHADLVAKATPSAPDRNQGLSTGAARKEFNLHSLLMSFVKDATPAWVKDHVLSIAKGMLQPNDYPLLLKSLQTANLDGFSIPGDINTDLQAAGHTNTAAHWKHFIDEVNSANQLFENGY